MCSYEEQSKRESEKWDNFVKSGTSHYKYAKPLVAYASVMGYYNAKTYKKVVKERIFTLAKIQKGELVLDAGCGAGFLGKIAAKRGITVSRFVGMDFSKQLIRRAADVYSYCVLADICNMPFKNHCFDVIICSEVLEHIPSYAKGLREFFRVLKIGGRMVITTPNKYADMLIFPEKILVNLIAKLRKISGRLKKRNLENITSNKPSANLVYENTIYPGKLLQSIKRQGFTIMHFETAFFLFPLMYFKRKGWLFKFISSIISHLNNLPLNKFPLISLLGLHQLIVAFRMPKKGKITSKL